MLFEDQRPDEHSFSGRRAVVCVMFLFGFLVILLRLFDLHILQAETMTKRANNQHHKMVTLDSNRGAIFDRQGRALALNLDVPSVYASPVSVKNPRLAANRLSKILEVPRRELEERLRGNREFVWVKRKIDSEYATQVEALSIPGINMVKEKRRFYPKGTLLAHVLGFAGIDSQGLEGLEVGYEHYLQGQARKVLLHRDAFGRLIFPENQQEGDSLSGNTIHLTIDEVIQFMAEQALETAVEKTNARGGSIIVMDPKTGGILAWTLRPTFDPNHVAAVSPEQWRNRAVTDPYEPGSTMKIMLAAAALEENLMKPDSLIYAGDGKVSISGTVIHDHKKAGWVTFREAIQESSNVAAAKIALELGKDRLYRYLRGFGFGEKTGIDLPGESVGILSKTEQWSGRTLPSMAMGQEIAVTPLQLVTAVAAIANGGALMKPYIVERIRTTQGGSVWTREPEIRRHPIGPQAAQTLTTLLENVVEQGTGSQAAIHGYRVAGKTGTAQKVDPETRAYSSSKSVSSFVGFAPAEDPRFVMLVVIDEPQGRGWGGAVAAPVFREVGAQVLRHLKVPPQRTIGIQVAAAENFSAPMIGAVYSEE
ncbi:penicillin-binding protein 2 [Candidatus Nitronereus thalassa]|uniref:Penicillin-binding protein 2 n=1 Tax=Candidatus Nitronereus thalassa TaxID=3020898 RepID=A0ABU3KAF3_9BACT|nr:penicillin-binding protein 2 [Candidatus Nitronereus thalassa]MDT7043337.1 penicillin-binding protein 2 [Candidatus Nitronereus thalassa]